MSIRETFSNSVYLAVTNEFEKGEVMEIRTVLFEGFSEMWLFRHLSNYVFGARNFGNTKAIRLIFFLKTFKISVRFQKTNKKLRKSFFFSDKCIWIGIIKLSLIRTRYFSSVANVLTRSPNIWHVNRRDFSEHNFLASYQWIIYGAVMQISMVFGHL